jgi:GxxExxY protein
MSNNFEDIVSKDLVDIILSNFYRVHNELGYGFLENVYKNALYFALKDEGLKCEKKSRLKFILTDGS